MWFVTLIIAAVFALDGLWWFAADRMVRRFERARLWRGLVAAFAVLQLALLSYILASRFVSLPTSALLQTMAMAWHLIILPATLIVYGLTLPVGLPLTRSKSDETAVSRRAFLGTLAAVPPAVTLIGSGYGMARLSDFRVRRIDLPIANLPAGLDGTLIAHVSDTHVGTLTRGRVLRDISDAVNALDADLVLHTGDLINHDPKDIPAACEMVNAMRGKEGVYVVEGNHDLFDGRRVFRKGLERTGVDLLSNETRRLTVRGVPVDLLGLRWGAVPGANGEGRGRSADRTESAIGDSLTQLLAEYPRRADAFAILLAHHPHALDFAAEAGIPLTLGGHTHGGQLMLPGGIGFGPAMYKYWSGVYRNGNAAAVISNGTGNWFPVRTFAPAEIVAITLRTA